MNWQTQDTIWKVQQAIDKIVADEYRPTRATLATETGLSLPYIHRLVQKNRNYIDSAGDGTVTIVQRIDKPASPKPESNNAAKGNHDTPLSVLQSAEFLSLMTRIVEALESGGSKPAEITKNSPRVPYGDLVPVGLRRAMFKHVNWSDWDGDRNALVSKSGKPFTLIQMYLLYCNLEKYLRDNQAELTLSVESALEWEKSHTENQQSE